MDSSWMPLNNGKISVTNDPFFTPLTIAHGGGPYPRLLQSPFPQRYWNTKFFFYFYCSPFPSLSNGTRTGGTSSPKQSLLKIVTFIQEFPLHNPPPAGHLRWTL